MSSFEVIMGVLLIIAICVIVQLIKSIRNWWKERNDKKIWAKELREMASRYEGEDARILNEAADRLWRIKTSVRDGRSN